MTDDSGTPPASPPLRLGLFAHLAEHREDVAGTFRDFLDLFEHAETLGVEYAWVRQFHLAKPGEGRFGGLPSPFVFLGVLAARTRRLRLGTAAVTLPLENPLRVAEDAAVLDALSDGRVELGLANGGQPSAASAFGIRLPDDPEDRRRAYLADVERVLGALRGDEVNDAGEGIAPTSPALVERVWHATLTARSAREAAERGDGVLIGTTQVVPGEVSAAAYRDAVPPGVVPRVGVSTWIFPGASREDALRRAEKGLREKWEWGRSFLPEASSTAEIADRLHLHYGTADDIAASIAGHPAFAFTTHLQLQLDGLYRDLDEQKDALALFVDDVAPALGWSRENSPARESVAA